MIITGLLFTDDMFYNDVFLARYCCDIMFRCLLIYFMSMFQDDSFSQLRSITCQLKEMEEDRNRIEARLQQLQRSLGEAEEGR